MEEEKLYEIIKNSIWFRATQKLLTVNTIKITGFFGD